MTASTLLSNARVDIRDATLADEAVVLDRLVGAAQLDETTRKRAADRAAKIVRKVRTDARPGLMETFLAEYGLSTEEGIALMCLAEALLRVPDADTIDALIEDKIAPSDWGKHLGHSSSSLVNASTWALLLTGHVLDERGTGVTKALRGALKRLGEPVIRRAVGEAMRRLGRQFVLGETIDGAMNRAAGMEAKGYTYSYDMLGEAARTYADAARYRKAYEDAIAAIAKRCPQGRPAGGESRHLHQALGAAPALRYLAAGDLRAGADRDRDRDRPQGRRGQHGLQHRRRGAGPARHFARRHRSRRGRPAARKAGAASAWWCRVTVAARFR